MQLHALDAQEELVSARQAARQTAYYCLECKRRVGLRGGPHRRRHFYHLDPTPSCRQHQKGAVHIYLQAYFLQQLPAGDCLLECPFPSIRRIADVAWRSQKIIFEIQCSPISAEEVLARNHDYLQEGWYTVWILHDQRYNQVRLSAAERVLRASPHFFCHVNDSGMGVVYDQFDFCENDVRFGRLPPLPITLREPPTLFREIPRSYPLRLLKRRAACWSHSFSGDLMSLFLQDLPSDYLQKAIEREKSFYPSSSSLWTWSHLPALLWRKGVVMPYQMVFRFLLERLCR